MTKKKRKAVIAVIAILMAILIIVPLLGTILSALAVTQEEIDALKADREEIAGERDEVAEQILELQSQQAAVVEQKAALDHQNELTRQEIEVINEQIAMYASLIENKAKELTEAQAAEDEQYERYRTRLRAMEENGKLTYIAILFEATSFPDLLARIDFISEILEYDSELEDAYIAAREKVQETKAEYEVVKAEEEQTRGELEERKARLEADIEAACLVLATLAEDIEENQAILDQIAAEEAEMEQKIQDMLAELAAQEAAAKAAAEAAGAAYAGGTTGTGRYIWPTPGYPAGSRGFGWKLHPILNVNRFHSGQDVSAPSGTPILAADGGTVAVANVGYGGGYGNYVLLNHGDGRATLYGHMSSVAVSQGQSVTQGMVIGYVGSTGLSTGPHLHYEVRINGTAVDPMQYYA